MDTEEFGFNFYLKDVDNEDIPDSVLEEYKLFCMNRKVIENNLLGIFDGDEYHLSEDIKKEIVLRKKYLKEKKEDSVTAIMLTKSKNFEVEVKFGDYGENQMIAELYLNETLDGEKIQSFIADYIDEKKEDFGQKAREAFNIILENSDAEKEEFEEFEGSVIEEKLEENKKQLTSDMEFLIELYSEYYVVKTIKILTNIGPKGGKVIEKFKEEIKQKGYTDKSTPKLYTKLRKVIDEVIKKDDEIKPLLQEKKEYRKIVKDFIKPIKDYEKVVRKIEGLIDKQEKKEEKKSEKKSDKKAKPASSQSAKKKSASKPAKKKAGGKGKEKSSGAKAGTPSWVSSVINSLNSSRKTEEKEKAEKKIETPKEKKEFTKGMLKTPKKEGESIVIPRPKMGDEIKNTELSGFGRPDVNASNQQKEKRNNMEGDVESKNSQSGERSSMENTVEEKSSSNGDRPSMGVESKVREEISIGVDNSLYIKTVTTETAGKKLEEKVSVYGDTVVVTNLGKTDSTDSYTPFVDGAYNNGNGREKE